jgi:hypothetical protein
VASTTECTDNHGRRRSDTAGSSGDDAAIVRQLDHWCERRTCSGTRMGGLFLAHHTLSITQRVRGLSRTLGVAEGADGRVVEFAPRFTTSPRATTAISSSGPTANAC